MKPATFALGLCAAFFICSPPLTAQTGVTCEPVAERGNRELGCFITARTELGTLPQDTALYWHLHTYASHAAAQAARGPRSTVVESFGKIWLFTIAADSWQARGGDLITRVGPLPLFTPDSAAAVYMEGVFEPRMHTMVHWHPGVEAWYTLEGAMCLETPKGRLDQRAGDAGLMVAGGVPMMLTGLGNTVRKSVVLILQDAKHLRSYPVTSWTPKQLCH